MSLKCICIKSDLVNHIFHRLLLLLFLFFSASRYGSLVAMPFKLCIEVNVNISANCCHKHIKPKFTDTITAYDRHYTSLQDEDDVAAKLLIKYSSDGSHISSFFFFVSYRARRLERSCLCSQRANGVSCMRSHEFFRTVFND